MHKFYAQLLAKRFSECAMIFLKTLCLRSNTHRHIPNCTIFQHYFRIFDNSKFCKHQFF